MSPEQPFIGIDFGTCTSSMAWLNPRTGQAEVCKNAEGEEKTPSVVYYGNSEILVGKHAEEMIDDRNQSHRVVSSFKRALVSSALWDVGSRKVTPLEATVEVLRKLKRDAETGLFYREVTRAVIACPADFDQLERDKLAEAGQRAGFHEVEILEEPVAAALAYAHSALDVGRSVLVYDLGGGTFDLALLTREEDGEFRLAAEPKGLRCGGDDLDRAIYEQLDQAVRQQANRSIGKDGTDLNVLRACRRRKEDLSVREACEFRTPLPGTKQVITKTLKREWFEGLIESTVEPTIRLTRDLLKEAQAVGCEVGSLILIGGSSRIPLVMKKLQAALPVQPKRWQHQDVAVALGAAYHGERHWGSQPSLPTPAVAPLASLVILQGPQAGGQFACRAETIRIGRETDCDICLEESAVSRRHAQVVRAGGCFYVEDLGSSNGTFLNGARISGRTPLTEADTLLIGPYRLALRLTLQPPESASCPQSAPSANQASRATLPPGEPSAEARLLLDQVVPVLEDVTRVCAAGNFDAPLRDAEREKFGTALRNAQAACDLEPNWPDAFYLKGVILQKRKEWRLAAASYTACLRISPDHPKAHGDRGFCKLMLGDHAGAREDFTDAILQSPEEVFLRCRAVTCLQAGDIAAAVTDLREALARADQDTPVAALHTALGQLWRDELQNPLQAADSFAQALRVLPPEVGAIEQYQFARACSFLGITDRLTNLATPVTAVQQALWSACKLAHGGCTRSAVMLFHSGNSRRIDYTVWYDDPLFAVYSAGIQARKFKNVAAVLEWLKRLLAVRPEFEIGVARHDPDIVALQDERIQAFFHPQWSFEESHGMMWNYLKVTNLSPFRLTSVVVTVWEDRADGQTTPPRQLQAAVISSGQGFQWDNIFPDGGFFGGKIRRVNVTLLCAESDGLPVQPTTLGVPAPGVTC